MTKGLGRVPIGIGSDDVPRVKNPYRDADGTKVRLSSVIRRRVATISALVVALFVASTSGVMAVSGYGDVQTDDYFASAVQWVTDHGYFDGESPGCFDPDGPVSRGEMALLLYRVNGEPYPGGGEPFNDVNPTDPFADAVAWLYQEEITVGTSPTTFSPGAVLSRGEIATFLYRIADEPEAGDGPFDDVHQSDWFADPVAWMVAEGITVGTTTTTLSPYLTLSRAHVVTFMYRSVGEPPVTVDPSGVCDAHPNLAEAEALSFQLLNELRASLGLVALVRDTEMDAAARNWSHVMEIEDDMYHSSLGWAENIAWWSADWKPPHEAATLFNQLWINSSGHYRNMTNANWRKVGIGFWVGDNGWFATHVFSR